MDGKDDSLLRSFHMVETSLALISRWMLGRACKGFAKVCKKQKGTEEGLQAAFARCRKRSVGQGTWLLLGCDDKKLRLELCTWRRPSCDVNVGLKSKIEATMFE